MKRFVAAFLAFLFLISSSIALAESDIGTSNAQDNDALAQIGEKQTPVTLFDGAPMLSSDDEVNEHMPVYELYGDCDAVATIDEIDGASTDYSFAQVHLSTNTSSTSVSFNGNYSIQDLSGNVLGYVTSGAAYTLNVSGAYVTLYLGSTLIYSGAGFLIKEHTPPAAQSYNYFTLYNTRYSKSISYRGDLICYSSASSLYIVNRVHIEEYLKGVVGYEIGNDFGAEALKAQTVAARNYAVSYIARSKVLLDTSESQVYRGIATSHTNVAAAVDATFGVLANYAGSPIELLYSASNGGQVEVSWHRWGGSVNAYEAVKNDPYDLEYIMGTTTTSYYEAVTIPKNPNGGYYSSIEILKNKKLLSALQTAGYAVTSASQITVSTVGITSTPMSGHTTNTNSSTCCNYFESIDVRFTGYANGVYFDITTKIGYKELYVSTNFGFFSNSKLSCYWLVDSGAYYTIRHARYGHGIGMSQVGARKMSQYGFSYQQILSFYYSGLTYTASPYIYPLTLTPMPNSKVSVTSVALDRSEIIIGVGDTYTLNATVLPENATDKSLTWTTSSRTKATVDENGVVTGVAAGYSRITAAANDGSGKYAYCKVTVKNKPVVTSVTPSVTQTTVGSDITFTAAASGGTAPLTYAFTIYRDGAKVLTTPYTSSSSYTLAAPSAGIYTAGVTVKDADGLISAETVSAQVNVTVPAPTTPIRPTGLTADKTSASVGDTITWTGTYAGGTGTDTKFLFRVYDSNGVQRNATAWQTGTTYAFAPTSAGTYYCTFKAKDSATSSSNMLTSGNVTVSAQTTTIRTTGLTADKSSASVGDTITWTGTYAGGTGTDTKFLFRVYDSNGVQRNATAWQTGTTYAFAPTSAGTYYCTFKAKDSATSSSNMLTSGNVTVSAQVTTIRTTGITADKTSASVGDTITWTGTYAGGTGTDTKFLFRVYDSNGVQRNATAWQTGTTYSFTPTSAGTYYCTFKAKDSATSSSNMLTSGNVTVSAQTTTIRTTGITADKTSASVGDTITWTGTYAGGTGTDTKFLFRVYDSNGIQRNATAWQTGTTYSFTPTSAGTYYCTFKAKDSATSSSNMLTSGNVTVSAQVTTIRTTGITADKSSASVGDTITWTGTYAGGTGTDTKFLFRVYDSNGVQRNATAWQTGTTYAFAPTSAGTYYCTFKAKDSATSSSNMLTSGNVTVSAQVTTIRTTGITADKSSASVGDTITWTGTYAGGTGTDTKFLFRVYDSNGVQRNATAWQTGTTYAFTPTSAGTYYCTFKAKDSATSSSNMLTSVLCVVS